jgi:long-chain acyl-CoA synthetase
MDKEGDVYLVGRMRAVINVGGMKVFPEEIEAILNKHPGVLESRVYGEPHGSFGAVPVAEILPGDTSNPPSPEELEHLCRQYLAIYKIPRAFKLTQSLPKTPSGKIRRH